MEQINQVRTGRIHWILCLLCLLVVIPVASYGGRTMELIDIDLAVNPNPIPCGGSAEATATIQTYPIGQMTKGVHTKVTIWDHDTWFRDGDDPLDHESVVLSEDEGKVTVTLTLRCQLKDAGCDLYGPAGESGESGTDVFVTVLGSEVESPHVYVKCQQVAVDAEFDIDGTESVLAGNDATVTLSTVQPVNGLHHASWEMEYDSANLSVKRVTYLNQDLASSTVHTVEQDHISFTTATRAFPLNLSGSLVQVIFTAKNSPANIWDATYVEISDDSVFYNQSGQLIDVCNGGAHSIFVAPRDTTPPQINPKKIAFNPMRISGTAGSVFDDMGALENYLTVALYDEDNTLVSQEFANSDGSFVLDKFFELDRDRPSRLMVYNGLNLSTSYLFEPTITPSGAIAILLLGNHPPKAVFDEVVQLPPGGPIVDLLATATDPDGDEVSLMIDWGDGTVDDYGAFQPSGSQFIGHHDYNPAPATYFIRVRAKDVKGREGQWSDEHEVIIVP